MPPLPLLLLLLACAVLVGVLEAMRRAADRAEKARRTAEKEAARRADAETRFRLAADAVNGVIYEYDFRTGQVHRTRGLFEVLGYRPEEVPAVPGWWEMQVHPDDRAERQRQFHAGTEGGHRHVVMRYRMRHKFGDWLHVEDRAVLMRDVVGLLLLLFGCLFVVL